MATPDLGANLVAMFKRSAAKGGHRPFLWAKSGGSYAAWSWRRALDETALIASCLADLGVEPGDRVLIMAENRPEWCLADLAIMAVGDVFQVRLITPAGHEHVVAIARDDGSVASSGICLSGADRDFDLASIVGVLDGD